MSIETAPHPLHATVEHLSDLLDTATTFYATASQDYAQAEYEAAEADHMLRLTEIDARGNLLAAGVAGKNETERNAALALAMQQDRNVTHCRVKAKILADKRRDAEARYREADQQQKALRVRLAAYTALLGGAR